MVKDITTDLNMPVDPEVFEGVLSAQADMRSWAKENELLKELPDGFENMSPEELKDIPAYCQLKALAEARRK